MQSEHINELASALCKAQMEIEGAKTDSANAYFKSKYADLHTCWMACRDQLTKNGLCVVQTTDHEGDKSYLITTLMHTSGQWIKGKMVIPQVKPGPQELGSCISYCRRYSLSAMVGLSQYDDDGEDAMKAQREPAKKQEIKPDGSKNQLLKAICASGLLVGLDDVDGFLTYMSAKFSKPNEPYSKDMVTKHALENCDKFSSQLKAWLDKGKPEFKE